MTSMKLHEVAPKTSPHHVHPNRRTFALSSLAIAVTMAFAPLTTPAHAQAQAAKPIDLGKYSQASSLTVDHAAWTELLKTHLTASPDGVNRIDYAGFKANGHKALKTYVTALTKIDPRTLGRNEQFAYWANLYNAKTIDIVLDHYPVKSIREISINEGLFGFLKKSVGAGGPWKTPVVEVAGVPLSLDNIEHDIMRPVFKDPRVHYAVNCASYGCPNLNALAFTGEDLETQLNEGAKAFINHPRGIAVSGGNVTASSIYQWFKVDFGGTNQGILNHVRTYAEPGLKAKLEGVNDISSFAYDWALNNTKTAPATSG